MLAVVLGFCLLAQEGPAQARLEREIFVWQVNHNAESNANQTADRESAYEERQFVNKFNHLLDTLKEFADQYNHHKVDLKKIKALKKAWRDLEKTDGWLRLDEATGH